MKGYDWRGSEKEEGNEEMGKRKGDVAKKRERERERS